MTYRIALEYLGLYERNSHFSKIETEKKTALYSDFFHEYENKGLE